MVKASGAILTSQALKGKLGKFLQIICLNKLQIIKNIPALSCILATDIEIAPFIPGPCPLRSGDASPMSFRKKEKHVATYSRTFWNSSKRPPEFQLRSIYINLRCVYIYTHMYIKTKKKLHCQRKLYSVVTQSGSFSLSKATVSKTQDDGVPFRQAA